MRGLGNDMCAWVSTLDLIQVAKWPEKCKIEYDQYPGLTASLKRTLRRDLYTGGYVNAIEEIRKKDFNIAFPADPYQLICTIKMTMIGAGQNGLELQPIMKTEYSDC